MVSINNTNVYIFCNILSIKSLSKLSKYARNLLMIIKTHFLLSHACYLLACAINNMAESKVFESHLHSR